MEIEEIIDVLRVCADDETICPACPHYDTGAYGSGTAACYQNLMLEAADVIESQQKRIAELEAALREQEERENPKPLTLDELRQMGKTDWVWVVDLKDARTEDNIWERATKIVNMYDLSLYGSAFLAYRSKPKE